MAWEEALEAHVRENEREFSRIAHAIGEVRTSTAEGLASVTKRIDQLEANMNSRFGAVDERFDAIEGRFDAVEGRFGAVDERFDAVEKRFAEMDRRFDRLDGQIELIVKAIVKP